tara:strand:- start:2472 stop:3320 length:849 start_codon:yes stop_codon:yes gene_type:complete
MMKCLSRPSSLIAVALLASCASSPPAAAPKDAGAVDSPAPVNIQSDPGTATVGQPGDGEPARPDRVAIRSLAELPVRTYTIDSSASELMESDASFDALAVPLARDMSADMLAYDIQDPEGMKQLLGVQMNIAVLQGRYGDARAIIERIRSIETSEVKQLMTGQVMGSLIDAWEIAGPGNDASADIFERNLRDRISGLSWDMVGEEVLARRKNAAQMNEAVFRGIVVSGLDPMLQENGGVLTYEVARQLVTFKSILVLQLPLQDRINRVYTEVARSNGAEPES